MSDTPLIELRNVSKHFSGVHALTDVSIAVPAGQVLCLLGDNGAGKSTLIKCLCGLVKTRTGTIVLNGHDITGSPAHRITRRGVGYMPQRDNVFARMTVEENLELGAMAFPRLDLAHEKERAFTLFPRLRERRRQPAGVLSGGERQMLALARAVISNPRLLLLDEPSAGVDPGMVEILWEKIAEVHEAGATILMVEQNARQALAMCDRGYVLDLGEARYEGPGSQLLSDPAIAELYLGGRPAPAHEPEPDRPPSPQ